MSGNAEIDGSIICSSRIIKSIWFVIGSRLTWAQQINRIFFSYHVVEKIVIPYDPFCQQRNFLVLFNACFMLRFDYTVIIWGNASKQRLSNVYRCIRRIARYVLRKTKYKSINFDKCKSEMILSFTKPQIQDPVCSV
jgi:hypothetical protein